MRYNYDLCYFDQSDESWTLLSSGNDVSSLMRLAATELDDDACFSITISVTTEVSRHVDELYFIKCGQNIKYRNSVHNCYPVSNGQVVEEASIW